MTELSTQGVTVQLPPGFEGRAFARSRQAPESLGANPAHEDPLAASGVPNLVVLHAATVPLPPEVGDFGSNVVDVLGPDDVFISVFEYDPSVANVGLFAEQGVPRALDADAFSPRSLQRWIRGQSGIQRFFSLGGRAFCLYVVLGSERGRGVLQQRVEPVLASLQIDQGEAASPTTVPTAGSVADVVAREADLRTFALLLGEADVAPLLGTDGPFTVFAPRDGAFASVDLEMLRADAARLRRVLDYHVVPVALSFSDLHPGTLLTLAGPELTIGNEGSFTTVDAAIISRPDLHADNGFVHVLDGLLEPPQ